jgi:hypothetical protein
MRRWHGFNAAQMRRGRRSRSPQIPPVTIVDASPQTKAVARKTRRSKRRFFRHEKLGSFRQKGRRQSSLLLPWQPSKAHTWSAAVLVDELMSAASTVIEFLRKNWVRLANFPR